MQGAGRKRARPALTGAGTVRFGRAKVGLGNHAVTRWSRVKIGPIERVPLRVPLLCLVARGLKSFRQMQCGLVERQVVQCRPEVEHVALGAAAGVEALEDMLAQVR